MSSLSDTCITSRAVSPGNISTGIIQHHHYHQHHPPPPPPTYRAFLGDGGDASSSSLHGAFVLGGPQDFAAAAAASQHSVFNASLRLPLGIDIHGSQYPVRDTPHVSYDPHQAYHHPEYHSRELHSHQPLTVASQPPQTAAPQDQASSSSPSSSSMRYSHADLPILNAETYSDGFQFKGGLASPKQHQPGNNGKGGVSSPLEEDEEDNVPTLRKRGRKKGSASPNEGKKGKKRARGRPRLNPKDQTPGERRRTQVRLAQRAYRNRKEIAITELESQVRDLKEVNDEMKDVFQRLLDSATSQGIAHAPGLSEHLQKLQVLVRRSREDGVESDDSLPDADAEDISPESQHPSAGAASSMQENAIVETRRRQPEQLYGGLIVTHEPVVAQHHPYHQHHVSAAADQPYPSIHDNSGTYQIIAAPTLENASFAANAATATASFLFSSAAPAPNPSAWTFSPWSALPMPASVAYQEAGFARRLHRYATEKAAYLICLKDPPQDRMTRVFGFARLFETTEQIRERTLAVLHRTKDQSLQNWNYPFYNLGGAGTHFPIPNHERKADGGAHHSSGGGGGGGGVGGGHGGDAGGDAQTRGFRFGPMDEATSHIRDSLLTISQNIRMPGLQGLFWDCDEVEWYMRQNGVVIPDIAADYCSVEVQGSSFQYQEVHHREADPGAMPAVSTAAAMAEPSSAYAVPTGMDDVAAWPQVSAAGPDVLGGAQPGMNPASTQGLNMASLHEYAPHVPGQIPSSSPSIGKVVQMDVTKFLEGLTSRAACLGRTPGFRPKDVDAAFWESVIAGQS